MLEKGVDRQTVSDACGVWPPHPVTFQSICQSTCLFANNQPGPCPKSKVTMLSSWLKLGSVPQWAWANRGVAGAQHGWWAGPPVPPLGLRRWAGCEQSWVGSPLMAPDDVAALTGTPALGRAHFHTAGSEAMGCGPADLFQIEQLPSVRLFWTKAPPFFFL